MDDANLVRAYARGELQLFLQELRDITSRIDRLAERIEQRLTALDGTESSRAIPSDLLLDHAIELLRRSRRELVDTVNDELLENPRSDD